MSGVWSTLRWIVENAGNIAIVFGIVVVLLYFLAFLFSRLTWWTDRDNKFVQKIGTIMQMLLHVLPLMKPRRRS